MQAGDLFPMFPQTLRDELIAEFTEIQSNFSEGKWRASGLNAGRFCEVCYTIIQNSATGAFSAKASKPKDFIGSCKSLEANSKIPHGLRMIGSRALTTLYEIRNNRDISHTGAEVNPSFMDASFALATSKWILAELVREMHGVDEATAQTVVDNLSQYSPPFVWADETVRRVLEISLTFDERILILLASAGGEADSDDLFSWIDDGTKKYFRSRVQLLHKQRSLEAKAYGNMLKLLPPGNYRVGAIADSIGRKRKN